MQDSQHFILQMEMVLMPQAETRGGTSPDELCLCSHFSNQAAPGSRTVRRDLPEGFSSPCTIIHLPDSPPCSHCRVTGGSASPLASKTTATITLFLPLPPPFLPVLQTLIINIKRNIRKQMHNSLVFVI